MARQRRKLLQDAGAVDQLVNDSWTALHIMIGMGGSRRHVREQIARKFPGYSNDAYDQVISLAFLARAAGAAAAHLQPGDTLDERIVPEVPMRGVNSLVLEVVIKLLHERTGTSSWKVRRVITGRGITTNLTEEIVNEELERILKKSPQLIDALIHEVRIPWVAKSPGHVTEE